ncbi:4-(cytidine 5'-diphospho)-2-C-methyl-D-erythritol kinase [bacterium]|nr:4-(cytidine 5'-diphospho)-2-C-methyl-D-erythritol kinase [bacterium]
MRIERKFRFLTPAKINFHLFIQKKRADGYHELLMDLIPVSLFDEITLFPTDKEGITLESNLENLAAEENLVMKAVRILEEKTKTRFTLKIKLQKRIPAGAGLGGGSGNAAGTLVVMNQIFKIGFSDDQLREFALELGADVPFFINPRPSIAEGIGEKLSALPSFKPIYLILLFPGFPISTKEAYSQCNISARNKLISGYSPELLKQFAPEMNDFWEPLQKQYPDLKKCHRQLIQQNAVAAGISGSGSTLFSVFPDQDSRNQAFSNLASIPDRKIFCCETLNSHTYI